MYRSSSEPSAGEGIVASSIGSTFTLLEADLVGRRPRELVDEAAGAALDLLEGGFLPFDTGGFSTTSSPLLSTSYTVDLVPLPFFGAAALDGALALDLTAGFTSSSSSSSSCRSSRSVEGRDFFKGGGESGSGSSSDSWTCRVALRDREGARGFAVGAALALADDARRVRIAGLTSSCSSREVSSTSMT